MTPPPVSMPVGPSSAPASRAAAQLIATRAAAPAPSYIPPSPPPFPAVLSTNEAIAAQRQYSIPPATISEYPDPPRSGSFKWVVVGLATLGLMAVAGFFALRGLADGTIALGGAAKTGSLGVNVTGPKGAQISGIKVSADGTVRCEALPCKIGDLKSGTHFVEVEAPGFAKTASRAVSIERGAEATLAVELSPLEAPKAPEAAAPPPAIAPATPAMDADRESAKAAVQPAAQMSRAARSEPVAKKDKNDKADKKDAESKKEAASAGEALGDAKLNINSIPVANVVLDGKPMGSTPLIGVSVSPGAHSVVFIHPEHGRKSSGATVKAGGTATIAVKF